MTDEPRLLRVDEAARCLAVGTTMLRALIRSGELPALHLGRAVRIDARDLEAFVNNKRAPDIASVEGPPGRELHALPIDRRRSAEG